LLMPLAGNEESAARKSGPGAEPTTPIDTAAPVARTAKGAAMNAARGLRRAVSRLWLCVPATR
jgi:hypothetical protein